MADLAFNFQAYWNPATNTPNLAGLSLNNTTDKLKLWVAEVAGTNSITGTSLSYAVGEGVYWNGTAWIKATAEEITPSLESKIFVVPADFEWSTVNLAPYANSILKVSNVHMIANKIDLPVGIVLDCAAGSRFDYTPVNRMPALNFLSATWSTNGSAVKDTANTFHTTTGSGRMYRSNSLIPGNWHTIHIKGSTDSPEVEVLTIDSTVKFITGLSGDNFEATITFLYHGTDTRISISNVGAGSTTIDVLEVFDPVAFNSPADYGSADQKIFPTIINPKGNYLMDGKGLARTFKIEGNSVNIGDFFSGTTYHEGFYDLFQRTQFVIDKDFTQTGYDYNTVWADITDANAKNYKGLSEGCSLECLDGSTVTNLYTFATGDFSIRGTVVNGRVNICNMYTRPLRFSLEGTFTDFVIDNTRPHPTAESLILEPTIVNASFTQTVPKITTLRFLCVFNARISQCTFSYPNIDGNPGQPIIFLSAVNSVIEDNTMDNGDSGLMFFFTFGPASTVPGYVTWLEETKHANCFKGFKGNVVRGNKFINMREEGFTCDPTDSDWPTLTFNRNRFEIDGLIDTSTVVAKLKRRDEENFSTLVNTVMTSISKGKFGKYCEIVSVTPDSDHEDFTKFVIKGSSNFFKDAAIGDKYAITYAFLNNIIENNSFVNCNVPVLLYLYAFHNIVRNNNIFGNYTGLSGNMRQLAYSARRQHCYNAPCIDNVWENNVSIDNGLQVVAAKGIREWTNAWLNADPEVADPTITDQCDLNTIIRGNTFKDTVVKIQGLTGVIYENNTLINTKQEITDATFYSDTNTLTNELDNEGIDRMFTSLEVTNNMLIPIISKGDGTGYARIKIGISGSLTARITGNAFMYDDELGANKSRIKNFTSVGDISIFVRCLSGDAYVIADNASNVTHFGNADNVFFKYSADNSPDIFKQKCRSFPKSILTVKQSDETFGISIKGNCANLPDNLASLYVHDKSSMIEGKIEDLPRTLTFVSLKFPLLFNYTPVLKGDLANLPPNCVYWHDETIGGQYIYSTKVWPANMRKLFIRISVRQTWTSAMVDQLLTDLAATTWTGEKIVDLSGYLPARTSASDSAVTTLQSMGVTVTT